MVEVSFSWLEFKRVTRMCRAYQACAAFQPPK